jgi:hypothetical protein
VNGGCQELRFKRRIGCTVGQAEVGSRDCRQLIFE